MPAQNTAFETRLTASAVTSKQPWTTPSLLRTSVSSSAKWGSHGPCRDVPRVTSKHAGQRPAPRKHQQEVPLLRTVLPEVPNPILSP